MRKDEIQRQVDAVRAQRSELENHIIDEYRSGYIGRREFMRRGAVVGMSLPLVGFLASACGSGEKGGSSAGAGAESNAAAVKKGGTVRSGLQLPGSDLDPIKVNNQGALGTLGQSGEYLIFSDSKLKPVPRLAESWKPNEDGSQWTFKIRQGVKFHDGKPMTAEDVAATFNLPRRPGQRLQRALGLHGRAGQGRRPGDRRRRPWCSSSTRRTATSRSAPPRTTTT